MYNESTATIGGEVKEEETTKITPKTRDQRIAEWREANRATYEKAFNAPHNCCSPTRANQMIIDQWNSPPID
jgi:predicted trehalose synthase